VPETGAEAGVQSSGGLASAIGSLLVATLVLMSCSSRDVSVANRAGDEARPTAIRVEQDQPTPTPPVPIDVLELGADPIVSALQDIQNNDPRRGTMIGTADAIATQKCAGNAVVEVLGDDRVRELVTDDGTLDLGPLTSADTKVVSEALAACHKDTELLRRLVDIDDPQLAGCILEKTTDLGRVPKVLAELLDGGAIESTSTVVGFRYTCQTLELDQLFGPHPGGTAGEDLRLAAQALIEFLIPVKEPTVFETACLTRGTMSSITTDWVWEVNAQPDEDFLHPVDYLLLATEPAIVDQALDGMRRATISCIDPLKLYSDIVNLSSIAPASAVGCLRDSLTEVEFSELVESVVYGSTGPAQIPVDVGVAFSDCGFESAPSPSGDLFALLTFDQ